MKNFFLAFLFLSAMSFLSACGKEKIVFEKEYTIKNSTWTYADSLNFAFDITDTTAVYDIVLHIRHRTDYGFQNLYTRISTQFPSGKRTTQILNFDLAENTGKWIGKQSGDHRDFSVKIQQNAFFNEKGKHGITLEQLMRKESLEGIELIRLELVDKGEKRK